MLPPPKKLEVIMTPLILTRISAANVTLDIRQRKMWQLIRHGSIARDLVIGGSTLVALESIMKIPKGEKN